MKKLFKRTAISLSGLLSFLALTNSHATSYQIFANIDFSNPAALNSVKNGEFIIGGMSLFNRFHFTGTAAGVPGSTTSRTSDELPYGRLAMRLTPQLVAGVDITQPYFTDIRYPRNSVINLFATETIIRDTNYSPRISYQVTKQLALGLGFDANNLYDGQLNSVVPPLGVLTNKADSWAYGWDAGLFYMFSQATYLNFAYYSKIVQHAEGASNWGPFTNNSFNSSAVKLPATFILNVIQMLSPCWAVSATARYAEWDVVRYTVLQNTAIGNITVPDHFYDNVSTELATHYQINPQWAVLGSVDYEPNIQPTAYRTVGLPTYTRWIPAVGAEYMLAKGLKAQLVYAHVFSNPPINYSNAFGPVVGHEYINVDAVDFNITYDV